MKDTDSLKNPFIGKFPKTGVIFIGKFPKTGVSRIGKFLKTPEFGWETSFGIRPPACFHGRIFRL